VPRWKISQTGKAASLEAYINIIYGTLYPVKTYRLVIGPRKNFVFVCNFAGLVRSKDGFEKVLLML
jgi:hypothetical protein